MFELLLVIVGLLLTATFAVLAVLMRRMSSDGGNDVVEEKDCMPLGEGLKALPLDVRNAIRKALKRPAPYHELCFYTYRGRDLVMVIDLFTASRRTMAHICRMISRLGYPCIADFDGARIYFKFRPEKPFFSS